VTVKIEEFLDHVQERTGLEDHGEVERTAVTVLQVLCDRLSGKEARDLLAQLPAKLKTSVTVTLAPMPMSRDDFVDRVAAQLQVPREEARTRIRAVFATLREAVSWGELEDVILELDPEYADLLA
jgi:uncharacterized protein (DUF2267 family)